MRTWCELGKRETEYIYCWRRFIQLDAYHALMGSLEQFLCEQ